MLSHGQKRDQLPKIDRAFSILGLWNRGFAAGGSLRPFRLPRSVRLLDARASSSMNAAEMPLSPKSRTIADGNPQLVQTPVAVEKGTKAVISVNFSVYGLRTFNNLRTNFVREIPRKEFFNTHACLRQLFRSGLDFD
jgi:hypothetical protein